MNPKDSYIRRACLANPQLSGNAKAILAKLVYTSREGTMEIGLELLGEIFNIAKPNVSRAMSELVEAEIVQRVKIGNGRGKRSIYRLKGYHPDNHSTGERLSKQANKGYHPDNTTKERHSAHSRLAAGMPQKKKINPPELR